ncbi:hypothetical protein GUITHDRAFT_114728 [Guillardia theta CCMP2712]|uniref:Uncharacterized protein n=1 Tax=Guillardia theta (strain CCMP2712) TaxID=905079 RepID=L1IS24_GUITC|nr:hypothetical protein GUITHDRAFT_114728 [Guillardia theta CCMP2712]EKX39071.1 hypothetical protein GUITHDRAFT_114728 [Guillardia theta CCMP2712]|eukprot:XP_005826051.1 hypothetical protein GUITHDRAFT_114728 [Guillardia theta CCMP2712]
MMYGCMQERLLQNSHQCSLLYSYYILNALCLGLVVDPAISQIQECASCTPSDCSCSIWLILCLCAGLVFQVFGIATAMSVNSQPVTSEMADHFQRRENEEQSQLPTRSNLTERLIQRGADAGKNLFG